MLRFLLNTMRRNRCPRCGHTTYRVRQDTAYSHHSYMACSACLWRSA